MLPLVYTCLYNTNKWMSSKSQHWNALVSFGWSRNFFSSPEPKARNLSVVRRRYRRRCRCRLHCRWHCWRILFTFSSSSQEPADQFQSNLAQSILKCWGLNFFSNEGLRLFPRGDNYEIAKIHWRNLKILLKQLSQYFNQIWHKVYLSNEDSTD